MLMGSKPKAVSDGVSKKMLIVIVAMLAIIMLPVIVVSVPFSKVVITITNTDTEYSVTGHLGVYGAGYGSNEILLTPGDERVLSYSLKAGTYDVYLYYSFENEQQYYGGRSFSKSVSLSMFETEDVQIDLAR
ncbi:hypothetical protein IMZ48_15040 [Candidatus Bathyarchaeota archaeon]|nr:hypothetical protein [Candidatus Bathyarchaeota archaeon]